MPQAIRGVFGSVDGLRTQVETARKARGMTWTQLADGSGWTRQYLQWTLASTVIPCEVVDFLVRKLNIRPRVDVAPAVSLLIHPSPEPT